MIWIDFGVICVEQTESAVPAAFSHLQVDAFRRTETSGPLYQEYYHFHTAHRLTGYWYLIWPPEAICYEESFFDIAPQGVPWVSLVPKWESTVRGILEYYIQASPRHRIGVLLRVQDRSRDCVHEGYSVEGFLDALKAGSVRWNELYMLE